MECFTRREAMILTRSSSGQLSYLAKTGMVVPNRKIGSQGVFYTWEQILEIRAINRLRRQISFRVIRKIAAFLSENGFDASLRNKHLVILADGVSWLRHDGAVIALVQLSGRQNKHAGQLVLSLPPWTQVIEDFWQTARDQVIDFEQFRRGSLPSK